MTAMSAQPTRLEAVDVSFAYGTNPPIVERWSARFEAGSMTALTGTSGRGKSTLLYVLGLMLRPTGGTVVLDGHTVSGGNDAHRARIRAHKIGFVFQDAALDSTRTVMANILETTLYRGISPRDDRRKAIALMDRFGVSVPPDRKPGQISGGQAQRVALCRALVSNPAVLLADEPTGNLDGQSSQLVLEGMRLHAAQGAAVIVVTHSPELAAACDAEIRI